MLNPSPHSVLPLSSILLRQNLGSLGAQWACVDYSQGKEILGKVGWGSETGGNMRFLEIQNRSGSLTDNFTHFISVSFLQQSFKDEMKHPDVCK